MTENHLVSSNGRVLLVDDTIENLQILTVLLETAGYQVACAANGKTALMICSNKPPELILLDIRMPEMDGYEVCNQLKSNELTRHIPIIFISALDDVEDKLKGFEAGAVDYITKPFQESEVLARVSSHINLFRTQRELGQANIKLQALDKMKAMFIATMSHELRTPLNAIISFSSIMLQDIIGDINEQQRDSLERMQRAGNHLLELITDVIDISKIEAGRIDLCPKQVSLHELVDEAMDSVRLQAENKNLQLEVEATSWPTTYTDSRRLLQCLTNLLSNAVKYSERGRVLLEVTSDADKVYFKVQDTGIGIPEQDIAKLFKAFERLESHLYAKTSGTGLGLYLSRKIAVELLQGDIEVESVAEEGSIFTLSVARTIEKL